MARKPVTREHELLAWGRSVLSGDVVVGRLIRLAVERNTADLRRWPATSADECRRRGDAYWWSPDAADSVIWFTEQLRHWKGEWAGQQIHLEPWQQYILGVAFGWLDPDGLRRFRRLWLEIARKNGKSFLAAAIALYLLDADAEPGAEVYGAATKREQVTDLVWRDAWEMVRQSSALKGRLERYRSSYRIVCEATGSRFQALASEEDSLDGLNAHGVILDEMHVHRTMGPYEKLETSMGSRRQPLLVVATTAGDDTPETPYARLHDYQVAVLEGMPDDRQAAFIFALDETDDPFDQTTWPKSNPNLDVSVKRDYLESQAAKAKQDRSFYPSYLRYHVNRRAASAVRAISPEAWDSCEAEIDWTTFAGMECFGGVDLSSTQDLTAIALAFPRDGYWYYLFRCYLPEELVGVNARRDMVPYGEWVRQGWLLTTPGNAIDDRKIAQDMLELSMQYRVAEWAYDPWHAVQLANRLEEVGIPAVKFRQNLSGYGAPVMHFLDELGSGRARHDGNPLVRWCALNAATKEDSNGNRIWHKLASQRRIDPIVAATMARGRALARNVDAGGSAFEAWDDDATTARPVPLIGGTVSAFEQGEWTS